MVSYYIRESGGLYLSLEAYQMIEAVIAVCIFRALPCRQHVIQLHSDEYGIEHLSLCIAGMDVAALYAYCGSGSIEILVFKLSERSSVHGVGILRTELPDIEFGHAPSDFLIRSEAYHNVTVPELRMCHDILHRIHYLGDSGLVVGSEQSSPVSGNQGLSLVVRKLRELAHFKIKPLHALERNVGTVIIPDYLWMDIVSGSIRSGVHMCDKPDCRNIFAAV